MRTNRIWQTSPTGKRGLKEHFRIITFSNRTGTESWRVTGSKRDGTRVRENFSDADAAKCRRVELETEWLGQQTDTSLRATKLTETQLRLAEVAFIKMGDDWQRLLDAVENWNRHGKQRAVVESLRIDEAVERFQAWLNGEADHNGNGVCTLRDHSRRGLRNRVGIFANAISNLRVNDITPDTVENFLGKLDVSSTTKDNYRRAISRFFSWCIQRPRRWTVTNPCREIRVEKAERKPPAILTVDQCKALLREAEPVGLAPYVALCLFGGLRPFEAARLDWPAVNLKDREIRLEAHETKTGRARVVTICDTLLAWLEAYEGQRLFPPNWRKTFDAVKVATGFGTADDEHPKLKPWPVDVMRHTAVSNFFRKTGSYGKSAEEFGNSEAIIKAHYQGRVSSDDTKAFYLLRPAKGAK